MKQQIISALFGAMIAPISIAALVAYGGGVYAFYSHFKVDEGHAWAGFAILAAAVVLSVAVYHFIPAKAQ